MAKTRKWKEWVVDHIKETGMCPGDQPSMGTLEDTMTKDQFLMGLRSRGTHKYTECHWVAEMLDVPGVTEGLTEVEEISVGDQGLEKKVEDLRGDMREIQKAKRLAKLKENLHIYVDRMHFKDNGMLSVPEPLLNIKDYISKSL